MLLMFKTPADAVPLHAPGSHAVPGLFHGMCRRQQQDEMIERDVMQWLVQLLRNGDMMSDYMLDYAVALLMNLCLRTAGY